MTRGSLVATSVCVAAWVFAPLFRNQPCCSAAVLSVGKKFDMRKVGPRGYVLGHYRGGGVPLFGNYFACLMSAAAAVVLLVGRRRRADRRCHMLRWVQWYVFALAVQAVSVSALVWTYEVCPPDFAIALYLSRNLVFVAYIIQALLLTKISLVRLRIIGDDEARVLGQNLVLICLSFVLLGMTLFAHSGYVWKPWNVIPGIGFSVSCLSFHCNCAVAFARALRLAKIESLTHRGPDASHSLRDANVVFKASIASSSSTIAFLAAWALDTFYFSYPTHLVKELFLAVDIVANTALALSCAGFIGPKRGVQVALESVYDMLEERRRRMILEAVQAAALSTVGSGCTLAGLFAGMDAEELVRQALTRFRCIPWPVLKQNSHLVIDGETLDGKTLTTINAYHLSEPCQLSGCDVFWSHSWYDDGALKWAELSKWCEEFEREQGRAPCIWFDRVCINQADIQNDLRCLPIFLAGCNNLLVTAGLTYTSRLWCCTELFVYMTVLTDDCTSRNMPAIRLLGGSSAERSQILDSWQAFNLEKCDCANPLDKERILAVIEQQAGGIMFNMLVKKIGRSLAREALRVDHARRHSMVQFVAVVSSSMETNEHRIQVDETPLPKRLFCI